MHPTTTSATPLACFLLAGLALTGCDDAEKAFDCIDDDRVQFSRYSIEAGRVGVPYRQSVRAEINNTPDDGEFTYTFTLDGALPDGITFTAADRTVTFEGTPVQDGMFLPTLMVKVSDGDANFFGDDGDADTLCRTERTQTYSLVIDPA